MAFPIMVTGLLEDPSKIDPNKVKIEMLDAPPPLDLGEPAKQASIAL